MPPPSILENTSVRSSILCLIIVFLTSLLLQLSSAAVYKVGDSAGWTTIGNVDYKQWAVTKKFQVGDVIVFEYNPQFHNVMQVVHVHYQTCNASSPISTHTTGNDSITIETHGHHLFLCGVPGHCQSGQKVDINVLRAAASSPGVSLLPPTVPSHTVPAVNSPSLAALSTKNILVPSVLLFLLQILVYVSFPM